MQYFLKHRLLVILIDYICSTSIKLNNNLFTEHNN